MHYKIARKLPPAQFKRRFGISHRTFCRLRQTLKPCWRATTTPGARPKLCLSDWILVCLEYWREYRTYFHIGSSWGVSESTVCRIVHWVEDHLITSTRFHVAGKKALVRGFEPPEVVVIDVTEVEIERPKYRQRQTYSGKQKCHTLKCQIIVDYQSKQIICLSFGKGRRHDFKLFKASGVRLAPATESLQDKGYQGIQKIHAKSLLPHKKPRKQPLNAAQKAENRSLARQRVMIEHVNRCLKIFRILAGRYRNRRKRFGLRCNLLAAIYNLEGRLAS